MDGQKLQRFLVRKNPGQKTVADVFAWNEMLAARKDLEEVWAESVDAALHRGGIPDPRNISLDQLESMTKPDLTVFAKVRLGMALDQSKSKADLMDEVKLAIFTPRAEEPKAAFTPSLEETDRPRARAV
jgi:hypothetical protein